MNKTIKRSTSYHAQALTRGLEILSYLGDSPNKFESLHTLHEVSNLPKSTLIRLLTVLEQNKYVRKVDQNNYRIGSAVVGLAETYQRNTGVIEISSPYLSSLARIYGHTAEIGILEDSRVHIINRQIPNRKLRFESKVGSKLPCHCTAQGKILLAGISENRSFDVLMASSPFESFTTHTLMAPEEIMADVVRSKDRGYAINCEEFHKGVCAIAVPIRNSKSCRAWKAAISFTGPTAEITGLQKNEIVDALNESARSLSNDWDFKTAIETVY